MSCRMQSEAESLHTRGNKHYYNGRYSEALSDYSAAIKLLESTTTTPSHNLLISRLYHNRSLCRTKLADGERSDEKAEAQAAQADARRATELDPTYVKAWALFARLLEKAANRDVRNVEEALDATHRVMELEVELCNGNALDALNTMGKLVRWEFERQLEMTPLSDTMGEIDAATALSKFDAINGKVELNKHLVQCIRILFQIQRKRHNISRFSEPVAVGTEKQLTEKEAIMYNAVGGTFSKMANFRMSISCGFQLIHLLNQLDQSPQVNAAKVVALYNLQTSYISRGEQHFQHVGKWIETALQLHNDADSELGIRLRITAAEVHINQLEYTRGLQELKLCLEVCKQKGYRDMGPQARVQMGEALCELGNLEAGLSFLKEAMSEFEEMGNVEGVALALKNIGAAQSGLKQLDEALGSFELALNLNPHPVLEWEIKNLIGSVYLEKVYDCNGANALFQKCEKYFIELRTLAIKINSEWRVLKADTNLAYTYALLEKSEKQDFAQFFENLIDRAEKSKFPELGIIYYNYTHYLYNQGEFEKAIEYGLKAEILFAKVIQNLKDEEAILTRKDRVAEKNCSKLLQICYICNKSNKNNSLEDALLVCERSKTRSSNILISANNTSNMQITIENIKDIALQINSLIVVCSEAGPYLFCWLILPYKIMPIKFFPFVYRTNLLNNVESFELKVSSIEQMRSSETFRGSRKFPPSNPNAAFKSEKDSKIFDIVLHNIEADHCSGGVNSMVIVPDGSLYNARFSCAKSINNNSTSLCFKYAVSICPSLSMIMDTNSNTIESNNQIKRLLIIGDPRSNLPFAIKESELLKNLFKNSDWNVDALIGSNATKQRVVEGLVNCNIIHIAAHANLQTDTLQVLRGSILLASCDSDSVTDGESDSELTYKEISLLDLTKLELAFLNCCETGSGRVYSDGLVGLARAFFLAGARQVVVYRGPLPDTERTTAFVSHFYREYTQTNRADMALAAAQRAAYETGVPEDFWAQYYVMMRHIPKYPNQI